VKTDYLNIIKTAFESHEISKENSININCFERSENYPNSEGIHFESKIFCGEVFMYFGTMKYLEAQFVIFETGSDNTIIKDDLDKTEIVNEINQFLDSRTMELKNIV